MRTDLAYEFLQLLDTEVQSRSCPIAFEMAYQARIATDRIKFAIQQIERLAGCPGEMQQVNFQLLDALDRLRSAEHHFEQFWHRSNQLSPTKNSAAAQVAGPDDRVDHGNKPVFQL